MPYLTYSINGENQTFELTANAISIGRGAEAQLRLRDNLLSRLHCQFRKAGDGYEVIDLESRNGTTVNGASAKEAVLREGDVIQVGHTRLVYHDGPAPRTPAPASQEPSVPESGEGSQAESARKAGTQRGQATPQRSSEEELALAREFQKSRKDILQELKKVIIGQEEVIEQVLFAMLARGHCLLVGVPGLAKTLLVSSLASIMDLRFRRIQFTPDLMPSDITGTRIMEEDPQSGRRNFRFVKGPLFANIVLADEINRTPPKTQAALLEAMQEYHVTAAGRTYLLERPFFVLATQNPIELEGTYPLPEAQLDRFMFNIPIRYPSRQEEEDIVKRTTAGRAAELQKVLHAAQVIEIQRVVRKIPVSDAMVRFAVRLVSCTRPVDAESPAFVRNWVRWGAGPRASQYLILGAKARSVLRGNYSVSPEDIRAVAREVLGHRLVTNFQAESEGVGPEEIVRRLLDEIKPSHV